MEDMGTNKTATETSTMKTGTSIDKIDKIGDKLKLMLDRGKAFISYT